ncbi:MAG TPA: sigma-70 family RNA polymerase sigma factor [Dehalococcoidia bacterium]
MDDRTGLASRFEENRPHLRGVAYRLLGSLSEADDAVQEAWLRLNRSETTDINNLGGWLTTVVARVCLDMLRSRTSRREEALDDLAAERIASGEESSDPERQALLADAVGAALLVVLDTLAPDERLAFVLHDMFAVPFDDIAPIVGRTPVAARQLASRARRRVQGAPTKRTHDRGRQREVVDAFLAASRDGQFEALIALLAPGVVLRADAEAVAASVARRERGAPVLAPEVRGAAAVATAFAGRARAARPATIDGNAGAVWVMDGEVRAVFQFTVSGEEITGLAIILNPARIRSLQVQLA